MPHLDQAKCNRCGLCVGVCARSGLVLTGEGIRFLETVECDWCQHCDIVCPVGAVTFPFEVVEEQ